MQGLVKQMADCSQLILSLTLLMNKTYTFRNSISLSITKPKKFWVNLSQTPSYEIYRCLNGKGCSVVQRFSRFEEAEFYSVVFDGNSYFAYSHNDYCNSPPEWIPMTIRDGDIPSTTTSTPTTTPPSSPPSTTTSTPPSTPACDKNSTESDILEVLDYPFPRFSNGEWISGMGNIVFVY